MSPYLLAESELVEFAKAIRGANDPDDAIGKAREAGYSDDDIVRLLQDGMDREFERKLAFLNMARAQ
jgi:hypothetical protein